MRKLYFMDIKIRAPPKRYHVWDDTSSDILLINCMSCEKCCHKIGPGVFLSHFFFLVSETTY
jgi:hypothetical protein